MPASYTLSVFSGKYKAAPNVRNAYKITYIIFRSMYWEVFMTVVFFITLNIIPLDMILNFHGCKPFENALSICQSMSDIICLVDMTCSFLTGYVDYVNKLVILDKAKVVR